MKHQPIVVIISILLGIALITPTLAYADEGPPPDAPYQESAEDPQEPTPEEPEAPAEEASPTLPMVHNSPMTPADPSIEPDVQTTNEVAASNNQSTAVTPVVTTSSPRRTLPVALGATLTARSIQNSRIWSPPQPTSLRSPALYASTTLDQSQATSAQQYTSIGTILAVILMALGGFWVVFKKA